MKIFNKNFFKKYIKFNFSTFLFIALSLITFSFAWIALRQIINTEGINASLSEWNVVVSDNGSSVNEVTVLFDDLVPGCDTESKTLTINNNGDINAIVSYKITYLRVLDNEIAITDSGTTLDLLSQSYPFAVNFALSDEYIDAGESGTFIYSISWPLEFGNDNVDVQWGNNVYNFKQAEQISLNNDPDYEVRNPIEIKVQLEVNGTNDGLVKHSNIGDSQLINTSSNLVCGIESSTCLNHYVIGVNGSNLTYMLDPDKSTNYITANQISSQSGTSLSLSNILNVINKDILNTNIVIDGYSNKILGNTTSTSYSALKNIIVQNDGIVEFKSLDFMYLNSNTCYWVNESYDSNHTFAIINEDGSTIKLYPELNTNSCKYITVSTTDVIKESIDDYTWAEIKEIADDLASNIITYEDLVNTYNIKIGDTKDAVINNETHSFRLIDVNHDIDENGDTLGMTFEQVDLMDTTYQMFSSMTSSDAWNNSNVYSTINNYTIDSELQSAISSASKTVFNSVSNNSTINIVSKLWIMSENEIANSKTNSLGTASEGTAYKYYYDNSYSLNSRKKMLNGTYTTYWLRSASGFNNGISSFAMINNDGSVSSSQSNNYYGVSLCFCIGSSTSSNPELSNYSWSQINTLATSLANNEITYNDLVNNYNIEIGQTKEVTINGENHLFRLVDVLHDVDVNGRLLGMTFEQVDLMNTKMKIKTTSSIVDNWNNSDIKSTINNWTIEADLNNFIVPAKKTCVVGVQNSNLMYVTSKLWLMSETEISNSHDKTYGSLQEGTPYKYYTDLSYNTSSRIKKSSGTETSYWLRSPSNWSSDSYSNFAYVNSNGTLYAGRSDGSNYGVAVCFCLGGNSNTNRSTFNTLEEYTWEEIKKLADNLADGIISYDDLESTYGISIGDTKVATINGESHLFRLVDTNHDVDINGNILGMTFEQVDLMSITYQMNSTMTSSDNWANSNLKATIDSFTIESDLNEVITSAKKSYISDVSSNSISYISSKLWIMSEKEISNSSTYTNGNIQEGTVYSYYSDFGLTNASRIKKMNNSAYNYWLRSGVSWDSSSSISNFVFVNSSGSLGGGSSNISRGIAICFSI